MGSEEKETWSATVMLQQLMHKDFQVLAMCTKWCHQLAVAISITLHVSTSIIYFYQIYFSVCAWICIVYAVKLLCISLPPLPQLPPPIFFFFHVKQITSCATVIFWHENYNLRLLYYHVNTRIIFQISWQDFNDIILVVVVVLVFMAGFYCSGNYGPFSGCPIAFYNKKITWFKAVDQIF